MTVTVGGVCSGIGGIELGLQRAGFDIRWMCEPAPFPAAVLKKHWPDVPNHGDITTLDWSTVERVDLICGGYPCQPFSFAGNRAGAEDERHLWPFMRDAVRVLRPQFVLIENVPGHLSLGFDRVLADLAGLGFDAEWSTVSACAMGAPYPRTRLFCLAHSTRNDEPNQVPHRWRETFAHEPRRGRGRTWSNRWLSEPRVGRVAYGVSSRLVRDPLAALGNAVVPEVTQFIGEQLMQVLDHGTVREAPVGAGLTVEPG